MKYILLAIGLAVMIGCASEPTLQTGPNAQTSFDGLVKVDNSAFKEAWVDPDIDMKRYNKVMLSDASFEFRTVKDSPSSSAIRPTSSTNEFSIDEKARLKLIETVTKVFAEEMAKSKHFTITDIAGPDVLIIRSKIQDIVSNIPPDLVGRGDIYLSDLGSATLVLELADSVSGKTLARASERSKIETQNKNSSLRFVTPSNTVSNWAEVQRWARRWASKFKNGLDAFH